MLQWIIGMLLQLAGDVTQRAVRDQATLQKPGTMQASPRTPHEYNLKLYLSQEWVTGSAQSGSRYY
jgi:hypothetical protein